MVEMSLPKQCSQKDMLSTNCNTLSTCCANEKLQNSDEFCFAVFRQAIVFKQDACWTFIVTKYHLLVAGWVTLQMGKENNILGNTVGDLIQHTFLKFWQNYTAEKIDRATTLRSVLSYLKSCAATTVLEQRRRMQSRPKEDEFDTVDNVDKPFTKSTERNVEQYVFEVIQKQNLEEKLVSLCKNEQEIVLMQCSFLQMMSPRDIMKLYPDMFQDIKQIYSIKRALKSRIRHKFFN